MTLFKHEPITISPKHTECSSRTKGLVSAAGRRQPHGTREQTKEAVSAQEASRNCPSLQPHLCRLQDGVLELAVGFPQCRSLRHVQPNRR